jgi:hypothetical protein
LESKDKDIEISATSSAEEVISSRISSRSTVALEKQASRIATDEEAQRRGSTNEDEEDDAWQHDPNIVWWDGPDDPQNPMNWSESRKWASFALVSLITFLTPLGSSSFAPGVPQIMEEFGSDSSLLSGFVVSVYVLGFAVGPLIIAPLSEMYGRLPLYHTSGILFGIFTVACALARSLDELIVFRFFAGCFGAAPLALGGGTIADVAHADKRATAMAIWTLG